MSERLEYNEENRAIEGFSRFLYDAGVDTTTWGSNGTKTIRHLYQEVCDGESFISHDSEGVAGTVRVAWVDVLFLDEHGDIHELIEDRQEYHDGHVRRRYLSSSLGEKFQFNEHPDQAMHRALREELSIESYQASYAINHKQVVSTSSSYPGLRSKYDIYSYVVMLNRTSYRPEGYIEVQSDKTNYYIWTPLCISSHNE